MSRDHSLSFLFLPYRTTPGHANARHAQQCRPEEEAAVVAGLGCVGLDAGLGVVLFARLGLGTGSWDGVGLQDIAANGTLLVLFAVRLGRCRRVCDPAAGGVCFQVRNVLAALAHVPMVGLVLAPLGVVIVTQRVAGLEGIFLLGALRSSGRRLCQDL